MTRFQGFNLIEMLTVVAIISILTMIGLPNYQSHLVKARRLEAAQTLSQLSIAMEQYHIEQNTYQHANLSNLHFHEFIADHQYQLIIQSASHHDYVLRAKPLEKQAKKDKTCASLLLNSNGEKSVTGPGTLHECW